MIQVYGPDHLTPNHITWHVCNADNEILVIVMSRNEAEVVFQDLRKALAELQSIKPTEEQAIANALASLANGDAEF